MKKILTTLVVLILVAVGVYFFLPKSESTPTPTSTPSTSTGPVARINGKEISLIVVDTVEERELGLGGRDSLPENTAMLFVFEEPNIYEFWMKDMKFAIDIIWLDRNFNIVSIAPNVAPETYPDETFAPNAPSLYVLETNAGFAQKNDLKVGQKLDIVLNK